MSLYAIKRYLFVKLIHAVNTYLGVNIPVLACASAIIIKDKQILVISLKGRNGYTLPGGKLRPFENFESCVKREALEETGLTIETVRHLGTYPFNLEYPTINQTFLCKIVKGTLKKSEKGRPVWKTPEKIIDQLVNGDNKKAVIDYMERLNRVNLIG
ncbi:MAG: NUDIX hydrolase [Candidatus Roizmanbacteria bacterium]